MPAIRLDAVEYSALPGEIPARLVDLLARARAVLESDPRAADHCLGRCEMLLRTPAAASESGPQELRCGGLAPWQVTRIKRHVDANLTAKLTTTELAAVLQLSENHFARSFKATIGCPPHAYVIRRRIMHAKALMIDTDTPLSQVALDCGLADQAHLSRLFRRLVGLPPSVWKRQHRSARDVACEATQPS